VIVVTTCLRKQPTIGRTIGSLIKAGWSSDNILISSDNNYIPEVDIDIHTIIRNKKLGAWPHWFDCLKLLLSKSDEDWLGIIQDDVIFCKNLKEYLNKAHIPQNCDIYSPFTPIQYTGSGVGWTLISDPSLWMAQTLFIRRQAARKLLTSDIVWQIRGDKQIDNRLGLWLLQSNRKIYFHTPSLAEHIGETSTLWENASVAGNRKSGSFDPDLDCLELLKYC
jgi:hypothetical protein